MQNYLTLHKIMFSLVIFLSFFCSHKFSAHIFIFCMLMLFFPSCLFPCSALAFPMLRLEFHVNQRGLKRLHWSTSSRLTAPPQPISRRGAVTSLQCASLAADAQCSVHLYRWKWITVSWETYFRTGHCYMYLSVTAVRLPGDPVNIKWAVLVTRRGYIHLYLFAYMATSRKGAATICTGLVKSPLYVSCSPIPD